MKKWMVALLMGCSICITACGQSMEPAENTEQEVETDEVEDENIEPAIEDSTESEEDGLSFEELCQKLSQYVFNFSSGAGGWWTELTVNPDGTFTASYQDYDMGDVGEDYPDGVVYNASGTGSFTGSTSLGDNVYRLTLGSIEVTARDEISDDMKFIPDAGVYGLTDTEEFLVYLPGANIEDLSDDAKYWIYAMDGQVQATAPLILNVNTQDVFVGDRDDTDTTFEEVVQNYYSAYGTNADTGFAYVDLNGDGQDELLIGDNSADGAYGYAIYDMYAYVDGELSNIFFSYGNDRYYLVGLTEDDPGSAFVNLDDSYPDTYRSYSQLWWDGETLNASQRLNYVASDDVWTMGTGTWYSSQDDEVVDAETALSIIDGLESSKRVPDYTPLLDVQE